MPLYDCMLLLKPHVTKEKLIDLVARVGKHVQSRNGVLTDIKSFGTIHLGYGIKKREDRYFKVPAQSAGAGSSNLAPAKKSFERIPDSITVKGQLMQMTIMATPSINKELHYLNKEDRLLRWLLVKHRDKKYGLEFLNEDYDRNELDKLSRHSFLDEDSDDDDDDDDEYDVEQQKKEQ